VSASKERWNEQEAILLLQRAAKSVQEIETSGTQMPHSEREQYHARLVAAHDAQDMAAPPWCPRRVRGRCPQGIPQDEGGEAKA